MAEAVPLEWHGKVYHRSDVSPEPRHSSPARPYDISIKGDRNTHSGELSIVKVVLVDDVVRQVIFPNRGGVYNPRHIAILARPSYRDTECDPKWWFDEEQMLVYKVWCPECEHYQRRDAFYPNKARSTGLQSCCKTCDNIKRVERRRRARDVEKAA